MLTLRTIGVEAADVAAATAGAVAVTNSEAVAVVVVPITNVLEVH